MARIYNGVFKVMKDRITRLGGEVQKLKLDNTKLWTTFVGDATKAPSPKFLKNSLGGDM